MVGARRTYILLLLLLVAGCGQANLPSEPQQADAAAEVQLQAITSEQLQEAIAAQKGKIVVVDFWATWCRPCKKEFPNLVELHRNYQRNGVVCMSVSVNEEPEKEAALTFLRDHQATFANFLLDEEASVWQERWHMKGVPAVLVFGRDGTLAQKFDMDDPDNQFTYADVNRLVMQLTRAASK